MDLGSLPMTEVPRCAGGVRLGEHGLHLGHYAGTFAAATANSETRTLHYIIKDTEPYFWADQSKKKYWVERIAHDACTLAQAGLQVKCLLSSILLNYAWRISNAIYDTVKYSALVTAHFDKASIRDGKYHATIRNLVFPIDETIILTSLSIDTFYSNCDNERIVRFARDVQRQIGVKLLTNLFCFPGIRNFPGDDHQRMHAAGGNTLDVSASDSTIHRFADKAFSLSKYFEVNVNELNRYRQTPRGEYIPADQFAPFALIRVLEGQEGLDQFKKDYLVHGSQREHMAGILAEVLAKHISNWRARWEEIKSGWSFEELLDQSHQIASSAAKEWDRWDFPLGPKSLTSDSTNR